MKFAIDNLFKFILCICLCFFSCKKEPFTPPKNPSTTPPITTTPEEWLIPKEEVFEGGPGQDGIPSVDQPVFETVGEADSWLQADDLVIGIRVGDIIRAYPHPILDWHEIVNDIVDTLAVAITYCPLTGTGIGWNRVINGELTTFGVSGLIYQTNLMPYDRNTDSYWSQMLMKSVMGDLITTEIARPQVVETAWSTWKEMYPNSRVLSRSTGFGRDYGFYPYEDYKENHEAFLFPIDTLDKRLPAKERVLGVFRGERVWAFPFRKFENGTTIIQTNLLNELIVVVGDEEKNFLIAYHSVLEDGTVLTFEALKDSLPAVMKDQEGNEWDIFGFAISGPRKGQKLSQLTSFIGYWFTFPTFYDTVVYPG